MKHPAFKPRKKRVTLKKVAVFRPNKYARYAFIALFAVVGIYLLWNAHAVTSVNVAVDFSQLAQYPEYRHYERAAIKIQRNGGPLDQALLKDIGTRDERAFVRLDNWSPTAGSTLNTSGNRYAVGDSFIDDINSRCPSITSPDCPRLWLTQEVTKWKKVVLSDGTKVDGPHDWYIEGSPLSDAEIALYESLWHDIVLYIKQRSPQTEIVEMMNEPDLAQFKLSQDDVVKLYVSNAKVVNQINQELGLPSAAGGPALVSGGPSFTQSAVDGSKLPYFVDALYARPDFAQIKPAFFSYHNFDNGNDPKQYADLANKIRAYLSSAKFNHAWDDVPIWNTAYSSSEDSYTSPAAMKNSIDPPAAEMARQTAGFAAIHHYFMESNVEYASMFAQSNYRWYDASVLMPEAQPGKHVIYGTYTPGLKTPLYNYFLMMSKINGQRVKVTSSGTNAIAGVGMGVGTEAVRGTNKVWLNSWNYRNVGTSGYDSTTAYTLTGLSSAGIDDNETATAKIYVIDNTTSNIGVGNHSQDDLQLVATQQLAAGAARQLTYTLTTNATVLIEIEGNGPSTPTNQAPSVSAGADFSATIGTSIAVNGSVTDDGLPNPPGATTKTWSKVSGPGSVNFATSDQATSTVTFSTTGVYVLRLSASDSLLSSSDTVTVTVVAAADTQDPSVTLTTSGTVRGDVILSADASDNIGVTKVEFKADGNLIDADTTAPSPYTIIWDTALVSNGTHTVAATAYDAAGNTKSSSVDLNVDNPPPPKTGDINVDGQVNAQDLALLLIKWKKPLDVDDRSDINGDGQVNAQDLALLLIHWKK